MATKYKKNYITNCLIRLDYPYVKKPDYGNLSKAFKKDFPLNEEIEKTDVFSLVMQEGSTAVPKHKSATLMSVDGMERIVINNIGITFETLKYESYDSVSSSINKIVVYLKNTLQISLLNRIGLRYVNQIRFPVKNKKEIFDWSEYLCDEILSDTVVENGDILQSITATDFIMDKDIDMKARLNTGYYNRNLPSPMTEKNFLIDIDGWLGGSIDINETLENLEKIHQGSIAIFEKCIKENLRKEMNRE